jgi:signal-transduction protein with cAMP-binding, CBS, and nucleotidyltransferase domain
MSDRSVADLVICEDKSPKGIVTARDFIGRVVAKRRPSGMKVSEIMSKLS